MRAAVVRAFGGPEVIEITNTCIPEITADQVLVRNFASGVNPIDTYLRSGLFPKLPQLPYSPGEDGAGVIEKIGENIKHLKVGDKVWYGAESKSVSYSEGACLGIPYLTAYRALFHVASAKAGDKIFVHGASGGVGSALMQFAAWKNIEAVGTAGSPGGIDYVRGLGAKNVYDHSKEDYVSQLKKDYPKGFNYIFEMAAHINLNKDLGLLAPHGKVVVIGNKTETVVNAVQLIFTEGSVSGVNLSHSTPEEFSEFGKNIVEFLKATKSRPVINKEYPIEKLGEAHKDILSNTGARGNLVIRID